MGSVGSVGSSVGVGSGVGSVGSCWLSGIISRSTWGLELAQWDLLVKWDHQ